MKTYLDPKSANAEFRKKTGPHRKLINEALFILDSFGAPIEPLTSRKKERMAICFLALCGIKRPGQWHKIRDVTSGISMKSRDIINYVNENFGENISSGSYDDIRRRDLKPLVVGEIVVRTKPASARNDPARGYAISPIYAAIIRRFGSPGWERLAANFVSKHGSLARKLAQPREIETIPVVLPGGKTLSFSPGEHNRLQKEIIELFLPRFAPGAEVLYVGDAADKYLLRNDAKLKELNFFELGHGELPDVVAYLPSKNWLFLIEAVHSFGPISPMRLMELKRLTKDCKANIVYVTAFRDVQTFRRFSAEIAWETEAWISEKPDHMIHFNGSKFLGPY